MNRCPLCNGKGEIWQKMTKEKQLQGYRHMYDEEIKPEMFSLDYALYKCQNCNLVYADPLVAGNDEFYTWVTNHEGYYPTKETPRWEWEETVSYMQRNNIKSILEIGCGAGDFLEFCQEKISDVECVGIDMTKSSCDKCLAKGLNVFCGTIEDYVKKYPNKKYDIVVSFHCLEHVQNPKQFTDEMFMLCKEDSVCMNSFPYSDIHIEPWVDCNNLPPHHMTRWCAKSCKELAKMTNANVEMVSPMFHSVYSNAIRMLSYLWFPLYECDSLNKGILIKKCFEHPFQVIKEFVRSARRDFIVASTEIGGKPKRRRASQVILIVLRRK